MTDDDTPADKLLDHAQLCQFCRRRHPMLCADYKRLREELFRDVWGPPDEPDPEVGEWPI